MNHRTDSQSHKLLLEAVRLWRLHWLRRTATLALLWSIPAVVLWIALFVPDWPTIIVLAGLTLLVFFASLWFFRRGRTAGPIDLAAHLNHRFPELEHSAGLLAAPPASLNPLQRLQRQKVAASLEDLNFRDAMEQPLRRRDVPIWLGVCFLAVLCFFLPSDTILPAFNGANQSSKSNEPLVIETVSIHIEPPAYTRQPAYTVTTWDVEAPVGSRVDWRFQTKGDVSSGDLVLNGEKVVPLNKKKRQFEGGEVIQETGFYAVRFSHRDEEVLRTPFYRLEARADRAPDVMIETPSDAVLELDAAVTDTLAVRVAIDDDYGLKRAALAMTLARGTGENVRFRDRSVPLPLPDDGPRAVLDYTIDLRALEIEAGDELYFFAEAHDNQPGEANRGRSATVIVRFPSEEEVSAPALEGLAIDLLPEYFRSQRQIIIDTEKLIADRPTISRTTFEVRANNLGIDQKMLRLRYGKFLGEEFESTIGGGPVTSDADGHDHHDHEGHSHASAEADYEGLDEHDEDAENWEGDWGGDEGYATEIRLADNEVIADVVHVHDVEGVDSFFSDPVKVQLKKVLGQMWESELRLRTFRPKEALPYQHRALEWLKELQQASRIYVKRVGFEPPPIAEKSVRFTGELDEIETGRTTADRALSPLEEAMRMASSALQRPDDKKPLLDALTNLETKLRSSGDSVVYLDLINANTAVVTRLRIGEKADDVSLETLRTKLWDALPDARRLIPPPVRDQSPGAEVYRQLLSETRL